MPTMILFGPPRQPVGDQVPTTTTTRDGFVVKEEPTDVVELLGRGSFAKLTLDGNDIAVWVNPALVRFVREA